MEQRAGEEDAGHVGHSTKGHGCRDREGKVKGRGQAEEVEGDCLILFAIPSCSTLLLLTFFFPYDLHDTPDCIQAV